MHSVIVFLPLAGAVIAGLFGRVLGARACGLLTTLFLFAAAGLSWAAFFRTGFDGETLRVSVLPFIASGDLVADWALRIDTLTVIMLVVVNTVSALVHLYSIGYMADDPGAPRFFAYLSLFTFAMLALVTADNFIQMFFGWEGVGLASYLLIGFWYTRESANAAAIKAFVVNRVGDFGFALGIFACLATFGTVGFDQVFAAAPDAAGKTIALFGAEFDLLTVICLLLFMGAMGKSAQFLLHTWLPDAMEGPTPVSALIHAATMVTAGVFMVARLSPLFELAPTALQVVTAIGAITAIFAATVAPAQNDIKRVIAYSTCSQLGYMFVAMGVSAYSAGMFHLFTHAFFKALLFLGAGSVIHALHHEQDMRNMGGLRKALPVTFWTMTIGTLALTGFPFTAGYFSKDAIIEATHGAHTPVAEYAFWALLAAALLTSFYSWRLVFMTFFGQRRHDAPQAAEHGDVVSHDHNAHDGHDHVHESPWVMLVPLMLLSVGALGAGIAFAPQFIGEDLARFFGASIAVEASARAMEAAHHGPAWLPWAPTVAMAVGFALAWLCYIAAPGLPKGFVRAFPALHAFLANKWYIDELYDWLFVRPTKRLARILWKTGDGGIIDRLGPDGISARILDATSGVVRLQTGLMYTYAFVMLLGIVALTTWFVWPFVAGRLGGFAP